MKTSVCETNAIFEGSDLTTIKYILFYFLIPSKAKLEVRDWVSAWTLIT